jgi:hypothetical protein
MVRQSPGPTKRKGFAVFNRPHGLHFGPGTWVTGFLLCSHRPASVPSFLCSVKEPFLHEGLLVVTTPGWTPSRSRMAEGHRARAARSVLDGVHPGVRLRPAGIARCEPDPSGECHASMLGNFHAPRLKDGLRRFIVGTSCNGSMEFRGPPVFSVVRITSRAVCTTRDPTRRHGPTSEAPRRDAECGASIRETSSRGRLALPFSGSGSSIRRSPAHATFVLNLPARETLPRPVPVGTIKCNSPGQAAYLPCADTGDTSRRQALILR